MNVMADSKTINLMLKKNAKKEKILFDLCSKNGEGIYNKLHIIETSRFPEEKKEFRVYHAAGYCFDVTKERMFLAEDESNDSMIDDYEYYFDEGMFEGFKEITVEKAIKLLKEI